MLEKIIEIRKEVLAKKPLIHHITNYVTVNDCANVTLAIGASPVMADDACEVEEMVSISDALVINIGTIQENLIHSIIIAGRRANELNIPVVFDPAGVGATMFRKEAVREILHNIKADVIKGNISEIGYLSGIDIASKGVDACSDGKNDSVKIAKTVAEKYNCVVGITAQTDVISDGKNCIKIFNGKPEMEKITGTGCMISSLVASCCGVSKDYYAAAAAGIAAMSLAGEISFKALEKGTSSYRTAIIDNISLFDEDVLRKNIKLETV